MDKTIKYASFRNKGTGEVRHLLVVEVNGHAHTDLILFVAGGGERLFSGTEYESRRKADELGQVWVKDEGFKWTDEDKPPYEPLETAVKLAMRLGHDAIYDPRLVQTDLRKSNFNATGLVQLKNWPGMHARNGGTHKYAVKPMSLVAEPQLPSGYPHAISGSDVVSQLLKAVEAQKSVGVRGEFLFASQTIV